MLRCFCFLAYRSRQACQGVATQATYEYLSADSRLDQCSNVCCVAVLLAYHSRPATTFECLSTDYRLDKYSNVCCEAHAFADGLDIRIFAFATLPPATEKLRVHLFSRVGACGRRPLESADPSVRRTGLLGQKVKGDLV